MCEMEVSILNVFFLTNLSAQVTFQLLQLHQVSISLCYSFIEPF